MGVGGGVRKPRAVVWPENTEEVEIILNIAENTWCCCYPALRGDVFGRVSIQSFSFVDVDNVFQLTMQLQFH